MNSRLLFGILLMAALVTVGLPSRADACTDLSLSFNASTGGWTVSGQDCRDYVDFDINGRPTVFVAKTVKISVSVANINPLTYTGNVGEITVEPIEGIKDLQSLLTAAGGLIRVGISNASDPAAGTPRRNDLEVGLDNLLDGLRKLDAERDALVCAAQRLETDATTNIVVPATTINSLDTLFTNLRTALDAAVASRRGPTPRPTASQADSSNPVTDDLITAAEKGLATHGRAIKTIGSLHLALRPFCTAGCAAGTMVALRNSIALPDVVRAAAWDKIATYPIKISRNGLFADDVATTTPKEIATDFKVAAPQAALLGVAVGIITTNISSPSFAAVASPDNKDQKLVTKTSDDKFAAVPALIGNYAFSQANARRRSRPTLQFGSSLKTDRPAWFIGLGLSVGSGLRLGAGIVTARIKALDGQTDGASVVVDKDGIKTKNAWDSGVYCSVSLSLSSLSLFSKE